MAENKDIDSDGDREDTPPLSRRPGQREEPSPWAAMTRMDVDRVSERSIAAIRESGRQPDEIVTFLDLEVWNRAMRMRDESRDARWQRQLHALINRAPPEVVERLSSELAQARRDVAAAGDQARVAAASAERMSIDLAQVRRDLAAAGDLVEARSALGELGDVRAIRDKVNDHDRDSKFGRKLGWAALTGAFGAVLILGGILYARGGMDAGMELRIQLLERRAERIEQRLDRGASGATTSPSP